MAGRFLFFVIYLPSFRVNDYGRGATRRLNRHRRLHRHVVGSILRPARQLRANSQGDLSSTRSLGLKASSGVSTTMGECLHGMLGRKKSKALVGWGRGGDQASGWQTTGRGLSKRSPTSSHQAGRRLFPINICSRPEWAFWRVTHWQSGCRVCRF